MMVDYYILLALPIAENTINLSPSLPLTYKVKTLFSGLILFCNQDTRYKIFYLSLCVFNYIHLGLFTHKEILIHTYETKCDTKM